MWWTEGNIRNEEEKERWRDEEEGYEGKYKIKNINWYGKGGDKIMDDKEEGK
jgi:hypothetical protein